MSKKNEFQTKALAAVMTASMVTGMAPGIHLCGKWRTGGKGWYLYSDHTCKRW